MKLSFTQRFTGFLPALATALLLSCLLFLILLKTEKNQTLPHIPEITYMDSHGTVTNLNISQNKLSAIHFWATWCKPCIQEMPMLNAIQKKFETKGFKVYALSLDKSNIEKITTFYQQIGIDALPIMMDSKLAAFNSLKLRSLPSTIFVNSNGEIIARHEKPLEWQSEEMEHFITTQIEVLNK